MSPKISIIIPVYNAEKYLSKCVDSIIAQTFSDWELILINDGSNDNSLEICQTYEGLHPHRIRVVNGKRGGVSYARNQGLNRASGEYVLFVDSDDYLGENHLETYVALLPADIIFGSYHVVDSENYEVLDTKVFLPAAQYKDSTKLFGELFAYGNYFGPTWNKLYRLDIIRQWNLRFHEEIQYREDEIFTFEYCLYVGNIKLNDSPSYYYRKTPNSLMRKAYYEPYYLLHVFSLSREVALQMKMSDSFRRIIEEYYTNSLVHACRMLYNPLNLTPRSLRIQLLHKLADQHRQWATERSGKFIKGNIALTDYWNMAKSCVKQMMMRLPYLKYGQ